MASLLVGVYKLSKPLALTLLDDSGLSANTCFDMK